jgi:multiple sugar transport system substrate-binding protein
MREERMKEAPQLAVVETRMQRPSGSGLTRARVLRGLAPALAGGVLAACGEKESGGEAPAQTQKPVTLVVDNAWSAGTGDRAQVATAWLNRAKQKYPHISLDVQELGGGDAGSAKTVTLFAAGTQGDLNMLDQFLVPAFGPKGLLADIGPTLSALKFDTNTIYDVPSNFWNGKRHGMHFMVTVGTMLFNRTAFEEAGVPEPPPTWNWNDFVEVARKVNRINTTAGENRWGTNMASRLIMDWFWSADVAYVDETHRKALFDTPPVREVLQFLTDIVVRHRVAPAPKELVATFTKGENAMAIRENPNPSITAAIGGKFQWDVLPRPHHPKTGKTVDFKAGQFCLATTRGKERGVLTDAVRVLTTFFDVEIQEMFIGGLNMNSLPPLKATAVKAASMSGMPRNFQRVLDGLKTARSYEQVIGYRDFLAAFPPELEKAFNGEVSVEQAALNMTRVSNAAFEQAVR